MAIHPVEVLPGTVASSGGEVVPNGDGQEVVQKIMEGELEMTDTPEVAYLLEEQERKIANLICENYGLKARLKPLEKRIPDLENENYQMKSALENIVETNDDPNPRLTINAMREMARNGLKIPFGYQRPQSIWKESLQNVRDEMLNLEARIGGRISNVKSEERYFK